MLPIVFLIVLCQLRADNTKGIVATAQATFEIRYSTDGMPATVSPGDVLPLLAAKGGGDAFLVELPVENDGKHRFWIPANTPSGSLLAERRGDNLRFLQSYQPSPQSAVFLIREGESYTIIDSGSESLLLSIPVSNTQRNIRVPTSYFTLSEAPLAGRSIVRDGGSANLESRQLGASGRAAANALYARRLREYLKTMPSRKILEVDSPQQAVCTIETPGGAGTGFLMEMDGRIYCVTNHHVIGSAPTQLTIRDIEQREYEARFIEVAEDRDLARILIEPQRRAIKITAKPKLNDPVVVLGNSQGATVITRLEGKVVGMGGGIVEVDAEFVPGNSGSPVIHQETGAVLGVATFVFKLGDDTDWVIRGTRFENARRVATRLDAGIEWVAVDPDVLRLANQGLSDVELFTIEGAKLLANFIQNPLNPAYIENLESTSLRNWYERGNTMRREFRTETNIYLSKRFANTGGLNRIRREQFGAMAEHVNNLLPICGQKMVRISALASGPPALTYWSHKAHRAEQGMKSLINGCRLGHSVLLDAKPEE